MSELLDLIFTPSCAACKKFGMHLCEFCISQLEIVRRETSRHFETVITAGEYDGWLREAVIAYKSGHRSYAKGLSSVLDSCFNVLDSVSSFTAIPIPTANVKRAERGYDTVGQILKFANLREDQIQYDALQLRAGIKDQVGLNAQQRKENLRSAFRATREISGTVVLVDDVITTGATLIQAAHAVRLAGATQVFALAICGSKNWR